MAELNRMQKTAVEVLQAPEIANGMKIHTIHMMHEEPGVQKIELRDVPNGQAGEVRAALTAMCDDVIQACHPITTYHEGRGYTVSITADSIEGRKLLTKAATRMADNEVNFPGSSDYRSKAKNG